MQTQHTSIPVSVPGAKVGTTTEMLPPGLAELANRIEEEERSLHHTAETLRGVVAQVIFSQTCLTSHLHGTHALSCTVHTMRKDLVALSALTSSCEQGQKWEQTVHSLVDDVPGMRWIEELGTGAPLERYIRAKKCASQLRNLVAGIKCLERGRPNDGEGWRLMQPDAFDLDVRSTPNPRAQFASKTRKAWLKRESTILEEKGEMETPPNPPNLNTQPPPMGHQTVERKRRELGVAWGKACAFVCLLSRWESALRNLKTQTSLSSLETRDAYRTYKYLRAVVQGLQTHWPEGTEWEEVRKRLGEIAATQCAHHTIQAKGTPTTTRNGGGETTIPDPLPDPQVKVSPEIQEERYKNHLHLIQGYLDKQGEVKKEETNVHHM